VSREAKHTPGPWRIQATSSPGTYLVVAGDDTMDKANGDSFSLQFKEANARLIAAAPDMLAVLKELVELSNGWDDHWSCWADADAAIAKATGAA
jgi:hypothetical protein